MTEQFRKEIKYVISITDYMVLQKSLRALMQLDGHGGAGGYMVRSLYFDSLYDLDLQDSLAGLWEKSKVRLRTYSLDADTVFLEWKKKYGPDGLKYRIALKRSEALSVIDGDFSTLAGKDDDMIRQLYLHMQRGIYRPKTIVQYNRVAYLYPASDTRVSFDTFVSTTGYVCSFFERDIPMVALLPPDCGVLEVKYDHFLATPIKNFLQRVDQIPRANSKYMQARLAV